MPTSELIVNYLRMVRAPIANYQSTKGLSETEQLAFVDLIKGLCQHAYAACLTILTMFCNLMPLFEGFTYLLRFIVDGLIDIFESHEISERVMKSLIFTGQLIVLFTLVYFIISLLLIPILYFILIFVNKILTASTHTK